MERGSPSRYSMAVKTGCMVALPLGSASRGGPVILAGVKQEQEFTEANDVNVSICPSDQG